MASNTYAVAATGVSNLYGENNTFGIAFSSQNEVITSHPATITVYSISSAFISQYNNVQKISLGDLSKGVYIVHAIDKKQNIATKKILIQ